MTRSRLILTVAAAFALTGCTTAQVNTARTYQQDVAAACHVAMGLVTTTPLGAVPTPVGPIAPWILGGCATEEAIARLALDPTSLAWINGLIAKTRARAAS